MSSTGPTEPAEPTARPAAAFTVVNKNRDITHPTRAQPLTDFTADQRRLLLALIQAGELAQRPPSAEAGMPLAA